MDSAHRRLREAIDGFVLSEAAVRSLSKLASQWGDPGLEETEGTLFQFFQRIAWLVIAMKSWIEYVREDAMSPALLQKLDALDALQMAARLEEIETLAFADDLLRVTQPIAILSTEFSIWHDGFVSEMRREAYFGAFSLPG